jgi:hypothetical protein
MNQNLDTLKTEIEAYLKKNGFVVFYGYSRGLDAWPEVRWDTVHYPDYRKFLDVAQQLGVKLIVFHHREFSSAVVDRALEELSTLEYEDQRQLEGRLRELRMYDGFTCSVEVSFEHGESMFLFELTTDWYTDLNDILEELDMSGNNDDDEDEEPFGGYYSKN